MENSDAELLRRARLAREVYKTAVDETESFEHGNLGLALAYLLGAILDGGRVDLDADFYAEAGAELRRIFPADHEVWGFIGEAAAA
jgi:hypothetical protein